MESTFPRSKIIVIAVLLVAAVVSLLLANVFASPSFPINEAKIPVGTE